MPATNTARAEAFKNQFDAEFDVDDEPQVDEASSVYDCSPWCITETY